MISRLARSRKFRQCIACRQLILPGEVYTDQRWPPWECDSDGHWWSQPACRFCAEGYWKGDDGDGWSDDWASTWADEEAGRWLEGLGFGRWDCTEPLERAQREATAFMAFLRRFAKHARLSTVRRVGLKLLDIGFQRPPEAVRDALGEVAPC